MAYVARDSSEGQIEANSENLRNSEAIKAGVQFLKKQFDSEIGLVRASPIAEKDTCWLKNDNFLAKLALEASGDNSGIAVTISKTLDDRGNLRHGVVEALAGEDIIADEVIEWKPYQDKTEIIGVTDTGLNILNETRMPPKEEDKTDKRVEMGDWQQYADLSFYYVIGLFNKAKATESPDDSTKLLDEARRIYSETLLKFDGFGFADKAYINNPKGHYDNFKNALAIIAGEKLEMEYNPKIVDTLLTMQVTDKEGLSTDERLSIGGFVTLSTKELGREGDANVETTSLAVMALLARQTRLLAQQ